MFCWNILKHIMLDFFVAECEIFARAVFFVDYSLQYTKANMNLVSECGIFVWSVFYVDNFWEIKISLGDFQIVHDSP